MKTNVSHGYCVYQNTICQGAIPIEHDGKGRHIVYSKREDAERSIAEDVKERVDLFLQGDLSYDEAVSVDEYVQEVTVSSDGKVTAVAVQA